MALSRSKRSLNRLEAENRESRRAGALPIFSDVCPQLNFAAMQFCENNPTSSWRSTAALYEQGYQIGTPCITRKLRFYMMLHSWVFERSRYPCFSIFASSNLSVAGERNAEDFNSNRYIRHTWYEKITALHRCVVTLVSVSLCFESLVRMLWYPRYWKLIWWNIKFVANFE